MIKSTTLKKLYPDLWDTVHESVLRCMSESVEKLAHEVTVKVCSEHHIKTMTDIKNGKSEKE